MTEQKKLAVAKEDWRRVFDTVGGSPKAAMPAIDPVSTKRFLLQKVKRWVYKSYQVLPKISPKRGRGGPPRRHFFEEQYMAAGLLRDGRWFALVSKREFEHWSSYFHGRSWVAMNPDFLVTAFRVSTEGATDMWFPLQFVRSFDFNEEEFGRMTGALEKALE